ncbi:hypothetical protein V6N13_118103 [Hibiscus sabdariffa]|uniref:Uncharacterized protein n=1 Tax=Hibiscus sabdariffa TaxID=183260 RepID=A0ABR2Q969_9ROSI
MYTRHFNSSRCVGNEYLTTTDENPDPDAPVEAMQNSHAVLLSGLDIRSRSLHHIAWRFLLLHSHLPLPAMSLIVGVSAGTGAPFMVNA